MTGRTSGKVRKIALMRVEHDGDYALVASMGGAPQNPQWYYTLRAQAHGSLALDMHRSLRGWPLVC